MMGFRFFHQYDSGDCGPACLLMVTWYHGRRYRLSYMREKCFITRDGVSLLGLTEAAEAVGFKPLAVKITFAQLAGEVPLPCIIHWQQNHFVVVVKIKTRRGRHLITIADPAFGLKTLTAEEFIAKWIPADDQERTGICLVLEPVTNADQPKDPGIRENKWRFLGKYISRRRSALFKLFAGMVAGSVIQLAFPLLTQIIVDRGIANKDLGFITLVLLGQLALFLGLTVVEFVRGHVLLRLSTRINISLVSDFLLKIMRLPLGFFDSKRIGDLMQRIQDHQRIQSFLTVSSLNVLFSSITFILFSAVLLWYNLLVFGIFIFGSGLYAGWVFLFMKKRRDVDYQRFTRSAENQNTLFQMITGMQEIKLYGCEEKKRKEWEAIQERLYEISMRSLSLFQYQSAGALFFMRTKDVVITFIVAGLVISGELTLGMMLSVQFILGQLSNPVEQLISFIREAQDAGISLERLEEINTLKEEESPGQDPVGVKFPASRCIDIEGVSFQYEGPHSPMVLHDISFMIPENKVTAIVGASGSGKTTLIKLLLGFYTPVSGRILVGGVPLENITRKAWRSHLGSVMQDGYIFSDTIGNNISISDMVTEPGKLHRAAECANLGSFIEGLPLGLATKIGQDGAGISEGQKQRILIARAIYRDPDFLFLDEATNALDAGNEKVIVENLNRHFEGKTVVIVAHRLSTVRNADVIIVLDRGKVVESGDHETLIGKKGYYYQLISNQLELG